MLARQSFPYCQPSDYDTTPFGSAEEAWFWFVQTQEAKNSGARYLNGHGLTPRPCEPLDMLKIIDRLYRQRRLLRDHLLVLRHYGRRRLSPDPRRVKEVRAHTLWVEALQRIGVVLERKGIIRTSQSSQHQFMLEGMAAE